MNPLFIYVFVVLGVTRFTRALENDSLSEATGIPLKPTKLVVAEHFNETELVPGINSNSSTDSLVETFDVNMKTTAVPEYSAGPTLETTTPTTARTTTKLTTTKLPPTVATTQKPRKMRVPNKRRICACDVHLHKCDLNCCCDLDCSKEEKKIFSDCYETEYFEPKITSPNSHSCFRTNIFYRENSPAFIYKVDPSMFCVVTENVGGYDEYSAESTNVDLKYFTKKKLKFSWKFIRSIQHQEIMYEPYKFGSLVLKLSSTDEYPVLGYFGLPGTLFGKSCTVTENIKFLEPLATACKHTVTTEKQCLTNNYLNANSFISNTTIVSNPGLLNVTEGFISDATLVMASCRSSNGVKHCEPTSSWLEPTWDKKSSTCKNVLQSLEITFIHAGIQGISKVVAKAVLSTYNATSTVRQDYSANFVWKNVHVDATRVPPTDEIDVENGNINNDNKTKYTHKEILPAVEDSVNAGDYPRSGNPGYIIGKPILMGTRVMSMVNQTKDSKADTKEETTEQDELMSETDKGTVTSEEKLVIALDRNPSGWMTAHNAGSCKEAAQNRRNVLFGVTLQTECRMLVSDFATCDDLQDRITNVLLGSSVVNFSERYVAAFGNPDLDQVGDWIDVFKSGIPPSLPKEGSVSTDHGCDGLVSTLKIKIAYAYIGPVDFPQAKIIGVLYEFGDSFNVPPKLHCGGKDKVCKKYQHELAVVTSAVFLDATKTPTLRVGQWPVVSIKLPHDFFYPFSATTGATSSAAFLWNTSPKTLVQVLGLIVSLRLQL